MQGFDSHTITQLVISFFAIIALIIFAAFMLKKSHWFQKNMGGHIEIISSMPLGTKEKLILLQVGPKQLLVGITSGGINTLHVFEGNEIK